MRTASKLVDEIDSLILSDSYPKDSQIFERLGREIESGPYNSEIIESVLRLYERFPLVDFGAPGALAHAIEKYVGQGYESQLAGSLKRNPTEQTLVLAKRLINSDCADRDVFINILRQITLHCPMTDPIAATAKLLLEA